MSANPGSAYWIATGILSAVGVAGIAVLLLGLTERSGLPADRIEPHGSFQIRTRVGSDRDEHYRIEHGGKPFEFVGRAGMYGDAEARYLAVNSVITVAGAPQFLVVDVGDPNNTNFFYLVHEQDGQPRADYLGECHAGVSASLLDPSSGRTGGQRSLALHRGRFESGRWLLLGDRTVLDTQTLASHAIRIPEGVSLHPFAAPLALAPDARSFVRMGSAADNEPVLVVTEFLRDSSYVRPIDRTIMRYEEWEEVDSAWLEHHFEWRRNGAGEELVLEPRAGIRPLPYRGRLSAYQAGSSREYRLPASRPELMGELRDLIVQEFGGVAAAYDSTSASQELECGEQVLVVAHQSGHVVLWKSGGGEGRIVARIAERFDQRLATGKYDSLFVAEEP